MMAKEFVKGKLNVHTYLGLEMGGMMKLGLILILVSITLVFGQESGLNILNMALKNSTVQPVPKKIAITSMRMWNYQNLTIMKFISKWEE